jgi:chemotaxis protein CheX
MSTIDVKEIDLAMVTPFLTATHDVFKRLFHVELTKGGITMKRSPRASNGVAAIVGLRGVTHAGVMVLSLQKATAMEMVRALYPERKIDEKDDVFADALGEIANIISGNAMGLFSKAGTQLRITTPSIIIGQAFQIHLLDQTTLSTELNSPFGLLEINVAIKRVN